MDVTKKVSIFLPVDLHRRLKIIAAKMDTSIQTMMLTAADWIARSSEAATDGPTVLQVPAMSERDKEVIQAKSKNILESGDDSAILNFAVLTEAIELWMKNGHSSVLQMPKRVVQSPPAALIEDLEGTTRKRRVRKTAS